MRFARGRGRRGPGLLGTMARTAVVAGTASAVSGRVAEAQHDRRAARHAAAAQQAAATHQAPAPQAAPQAPAAQAAAPQAAAPSVDELHAQLLKLGELRTAGLLTDDEFAVQKSRLLGG
ncbi:hypothetical protein GCM10009613_19800 [Pseudonocardia kongjuensis]|uniref:SHOCT domain-containing protein n=1 Tax=Pseudonocardia kongjuensis TaxID=102227 RepID=A0ABP4IB24_9PSEU